MRTWLTPLLILIIVASGYRIAEAVEQNPSTFMLQFESTQTKTDEGITTTSRVVASFVLDPVAGDPGRYRGQGRLRYTMLDGIAATPSDGVLTITDMQVSSEDGTVVLDLFPGDPKPIEWFIISPVTAVKQFQWFSGFGLFHNNELGEGGFTIDNWQYPEGEIYAKKTYSRTKTVENVFMEESTTIELTPIPDPPRIDKINLLSKGTSADDAETGEDLELSADLYVPHLFEIERCTWTGNNFTDPGKGDPDDSCRWTYRPKEGEGPQRDTYGQKDLKLTVVYRYGVWISAMSINKSLDYKVFFTKKGDDNSDNDPNWFDYWGEDGAVPGLDAANVEYNAALPSDDIAEADGTKVVFGPAGADSDESSEIPSNDHCPGGTFPGGDGIDLTALSLAHEKKHIELDALTGKDTDGDDVPDSIETTTSPTDPDSCNLAAEIDPDYATYGDNEFIALQAELGVEGVDKKDWAVPGRQATVKTVAASSMAMASSGVLPKLFPGAQILLSRGAIEAVPLAANGLLTGIYSAVGQDPNGDGLFASMQLDVGLNIIDAGHYAVIAWLADDQGTELSWARVEVDLMPGGTTVKSVFDGPALSQVGVTQPFVVSRVELYYRVGKHSVLADSAQNVLITGLDSSAFKPPAATLAGTITELPVDADFDGHINRLEIAVDLDIHEAGEYEVSAQLRGTTLALFDAQSIVVADGVSSAQVILSFDGSPVFFNREDGPFELTSLRVKTVPSGSELDYLAAAWTTTAYPFNAFQHSGIVIDENSYGDTGGALDSDGKYLTLDLMFEVSSMVSGPYIVNASLEDAQGRTIARASSVTGLGGVEGFAEISPVMLSFPAQEIFTAGIDGPYQVADVTVIADDGTVMDQNPVPWMTTAYSADDFGLLPVTEEIFMDGFE